MRFVTMLSLFAVVSGCDNRETPCEQTADEIRDRLEDCGVTFHDYHDDLGAECTEDLAVIEACYLDCYERTPCTVLVGPATDEYLAFIDCLEDCLAQSP